MFDKSSSSHSLVLHFIYQKWHVKICNQVIMSYILEAYNLIHRWASWKKWIHHWMIGWFNHFGVVYDRWESFLPPECRAAYEPRKKHNNSYFPLNPRCLRTGSLFHGLWNNPHITEVSCPIYTKQRYGGHLRPYLSVTCDPTPLKPETRSLATLPLFTAPTTQNYTWSLATLPTTTRENTTRSLATLPTQIGRVTSDH